MYELALYFEDREIGIVYGSDGKLWHKFNTYYMEGEIKYMPITEKDTQYERLYASPALSTCPFHTNSVCVCVEVIAWVRRQLFFSMIGEKSK